MRLLLSSANAGTRTDTPQSPTRAHPRPHPRTYDNAYTHTHSLAQTQVKQLKKKVAKQETDHRLYVKVG